ncbi:MAG: hypothetical protein CME63_17800 [Halobacteriovoraceae bacterium]|nr:hypothetical protein [Halobacteriovoraceae bacterium]MBC99604.1 hypothetical protein [Halobacteriovoraceae bacterium]|tara:strand:- start:13093 stop:13878 length:786 start_codon:yes stop_codon:yes gene_type:complete
MKLNLIILAMLTSLAFNSCSTPRPSGETEAEILYKEAQQLSESGRYLLATEKLNQIRSKYPYSYYATFAELMGADVLYEQENYAEAAAAYIVFKDFHPRHKKAAYVMYRIGESFYNQIPDTYDRDLGPAFEAIKYFQELKRVHSSSEYAEKAQKRIDECEGMVRSKEQYIADFYFKTEVYKAARFRYKSIIEEFREPKMRSHAMVRSFLASAEMGDKTYCRQHNEFYKQMVTEDYLEDLTSAYDECLNTEVVMKTDEDKKD